jgi:hypothetical protein
VNQAGAIEFFRGCFNALAVFTFFVLLSAAVGGGDWGSTGISFFFVLASYPLGALAFTVVSQEFLDAIENPYTRAFVMWAPFFVLGWIQWGIIFPVLRLLVQRMRGVKRAV